MLYRSLKAHPQLAFPKIKEGYYYRAPEKVRKLRAGLAESGRILADVSNLAYLDPALAGGIMRLRGDDCRVLLVVLLRPHIDRAASMIRFRESRGEHSLWGGRPKLEREVLRDSLTPELLETIYRLDGDVLTVPFDALTGNLTGVLGVVAEVCSIAEFARPPAGAVNESLRARNVLLARLGKLAALGLRRLGWRRTLQRVKDSGWAQRLFFRPLAAEEREVVLAAESRECLEGMYRDCCALVAKRSERMAAGIYFRKGSYPPPPPDFG